MTERSADQPLQVFCVYQELKCHNKSQKAEPDDIRVQSRLDQCQSGAHQEYSFKKQSFLMNQPTTDPANATTPIMDVTVARMILVVEPTSSSWGA